MKLAARHRGIVFFCFADHVGFAGQRAAFLLLVTRLAERGWDCRKLPQPVLERGDGRLLAVLTYAMGLATSWFRALALFGSRDAILCVNLGMTLAAFVRDAFPIFLGRMLLGRDQIVISLHGSLFMNWHDSGPEVRVFRLLLRQAGAITVLGERQRQRLVELGIPAENIRIVVNSCDLAPIDADNLLAKHSPRAREPGVVTILYLSSLIDTKGYPEYLEALRSLSRSQGVQIEAVLCGKLVPSEFADRQVGAEQSECLIKGKIAEINLGSRVKARWVNGAVGAEKAALFRNADIFVLPTRYAVEAQPLVLLEAMASGCAIVTTRVGEITTILNGTCALFLEEPSVGALATALERLAEDAGQRRRIAIQAHARFGVRYSVGQHLDVWEDILSQCQPESRSVA